MKLQSICMFCMIKGILFYLYTIQTSGNLVGFLSKVKIDKKTTFLQKFLFKFQKNASRQMSCMQVDRSKCKLRNSKSLSPSTSFTHLCKCICVCHALIQAYSCISISFGYCRPILFLTNSQILLRNAKACFPK